MNKKKTYTILILTFLFMAVSIIIFTLLFSLIKNKNQNSSLINLEINQKIEDKKNLSNLERTIKDTNSQREILQSYILNEKNIDKFIDWLELNGENMGTEVVVNSVNSIGAKNALEVSLNINGDFNNVLKFIFFLENSNYKIDIKDLFLSKLKKQENENSPEIYYWQGQVKFYIISTKD